MSFVIATPSSAIRPKPLWPSTGLAISDTAGNATQQNSKVVSDGNSGYVFAWEDSRYGDSGIFVEKLDEQGNLLWNGSGVAVSRSKGTQNATQLITDNAGGVIVVWQDYRDGNADIYAQKVSAGGVPQWGEAGIQVCAANAGQFAPVLTSDGAGGAIIAWHDYRSNVGEDIYAQHLDGGGRGLWKANGLPVCAAQGTQWFPAMAGDGQGGAVISWTDGRNGPADNNIYAQRVDSSGNSLWQKDGLPVCQSGGNQEKPTLIAVTDGFILAWNDSRSGNIDIFSQKIGLDGSALWNKDGIAIATLPFSQEGPQLTSDGAGGAIVAWTDGREETTNIYAQRIYQDGRIAWQENGLPLARSDADQKDPTIVKLAKDEWAIVWEDYRGGKPQLFAQKIDSTGTGLWNRTGLAVAPAPREELPAVAVSPAGNLIVAWQDARRGNYDIYAQKLSADGSAWWSKSGVLVCAALGSVVHQNLQSIETKNGEVIMVFEDARSGYYNVYAQKISRAGSLSWGANALPISKANANQTDPRIVADNSGGAFVCWEEQGTIHAQRLASSGARVWDASLVVGQGTGKQSNPLMIGDDNGGAIIVWIDERNPLSLQDLYGQKLSAGGDQLWGKRGKVVSDANGNQTEPAIASDGQAGVIATWSDYRNGERNPDIYAQRLDIGGNRLWSKEDVLVCGAPDVQRRPALIEDGDGGAIIAWTDKGGGSYDIYAQHLSRAGQALWMKDGVPISQLARTQQNPVFGNRNIIVWEDYRFGNWDIFAGAISPAGKLLWGENGVPLASVPFTQYAPACSASPWNDGAIVAWEDYRSGRQYEIFIQLVDGSGKIAWEDNGVRVDSQDGARTPKIIVLSGEKIFYVFWEDYTNGGRSLYGQRFRV